MKNFKFTSLRLLLFYVFLFSAVSLVFYSCSDDSDSISEPSNPAPFRCASCNSQPDAKIEYDNSYKGVYKGVTSRGIVVIDFMNSTENITSLITLDGVRYNLEVKNVLTDNNNYTIEFKGINNPNDVSLIFTVNAYGKEIKISSNLFPELTTIVKEKSYALLEAFEGDYSLRVYSATGLELDKNNLVASNNNYPNLTGKFNMLIYRANNVFYLSDNNQTEPAWWIGFVSLSGKPYFHNGTINQNNELIDLDNNFIGKLNVDEIKGISYARSIKGAYLNSKRVY